MLLNLTVRCVKKLLIKVIVLNFSFSQEIRCNVRVYSVETLLQMAKDMTPLIATPNGKV